MHRLMLLEAPGKEVGQGRRRYPGEARERVDRVGAGLHSYVLWVEGRAGAVGLENPPLHLCTYQ